MLRSCDFGAQDGNVHDDFFQKRACTIKVVFGVKYLVIVL